MELKMESRFDVMEKHTEIKFNFSVKEQGETFS